MKARATKPIQPWVWWAAGGATLLLLGKTAASNTNAFGPNAFGPDSNAKLNRDPARLLPGFRAKLGVLLSRMRARGFDAILWEGYREPSRAAELARQGVGITDSMHSYGAAADIVDRKLLWNAPAAFWAALGQEAEKLGLTWGGRFSRVDKPHVQAVAYAQQTAMRNGPQAVRERLAA